MEGVAAESGVARRAPRARQAGRVLGRQPHHDRRHDGDLLHRGRRRALRGLRLAGAAPRRRRRPRRDRRASWRGAADEARPTLVVTRTHIGIGSPRQDTPKAHGEPLGDENVALTKEDYGWPEDAQFLVPDEVRDAYAAVARARRRGPASCGTTPAMRCARDARRARRASSGAACAASCPPAGPTGLAASRSRTPAPRRHAQSSGQAIDRVAPRLPELVGGSADLAGSNLTDDHGRRRRRAADYAGRNLHFGIREHAMGAIINGMLAHGGVRAVRRRRSSSSATTCARRSGSRRCRACRRSSCSRTTRSYLGEDGPTHQPIEQLASLRAMPNLLVLRPAEAQRDAGGVEGRARAARPPRRARTHAPEARAVPLRRRFAARRRATSRAAAYVLREATGGAPEVVLIAHRQRGARSRSRAATRLEEDGTPTRVVSMPCQELFVEQPREYRDAVLPPRVRARVVGRGGRHVRLGALRGRCRRDGRHRPVRPLGARRPGGGRARHQRSTRVVAARAPHARDRRTAGRRT